jgi:hypothetical protein
MTYILHSSYLFYHPGKQPVTFGEVLGTWPCTAVQPRMRLFLLASLQQSCQFVGSSHSWPLMQKRLLLQETQDDELKNIAPGSNLG